MAPTVNDLRRHANVGFMRKLALGYLVPHNPEKSVRRHELFGTPIIRRVVMGTVGKNFDEPNYDSNYRLNRSRNRLEAATHFAMQGSVFNEKRHGIVGLGCIPLLAFDCSVGGASGVISGALIGAVMIAEVQLVALQRYNRARMIVRANDELAKGETFSEGYVNDFGLDSEAYASWSQDGLD